MEDPPSYAHARGEGNVQASELAVVACLRVTWRQFEVGFQLLDRIHGTRIALAADPDAAQGALEAGVGRPFVG